MGYINSASTTTVIAKLTPYGRKKLLSTSNTDFVSYFAFGDSDANYQTNQILTEGEVPVSSGDLTSNSITSTSVADGISIRNKLIFDNAGNQYKAVGTGSFEVTEAMKYLGNITLTGSSLTFNKINRNDHSSESLVNLFTTFGLPVTSSDISKFISVPNSNGGYNDTAISGLANYQALVISIPNNNFGEIIDGKTIKLSLLSSGTTYNCYGTYLRSGAITTDLDSSIKEMSNNITIGDNVVVLFSDEIKKPNGDISKSWGTGYGEPKPFTLGGKEQFNYTTNQGKQLTADTAIGVAYLDKGFIVITDNTIVSGFNPAADFTGTTLYFNSLYTEIGQSIVCDALTSEFRNSSNPTFTTGVDIPRVTEVGLYDKDYQLVAIAKLSEPYLLGNMYFRIEVKISV